MQTKIAHLDFFAVRDLEWMKILATAMESLEYITEVEDVEWKSFFILKHGIEFNGDDALEPYTSTISSSGSTYINRDMIFVTCRYTIDYTKPEEYIKPTLEEYEYPEDNGYPEEYEQPKPEEYAQPQPTKSNDPLKKNHHTIPNPDSIDETEDDDDLFKVVTAAYVEHIEVEPFNATTAVPLYDLYEDNEHRRIFIIDANIQKWYSQRDMKAMRDKHSNNSSDFVFNPCNGDFPVKDGEEFKYCGPWNHCPSGYECLNQFYDYRTVCCNKSLGEKQYDYPCKGNILRNPVTNRRAWCLRHHHICPNNYICSSELEDAPTVCCEPEGGLDNHPTPVYPTHQCGKGAEPATYIGTNEVILCSYGCPYNLVCGFGFGLNKTVCYCHSNLGIYYTSTGINQLPPQAKKICH